jgi:hypothetical protein
VIWDKPSSMPEAVTDRVRRSHEHWFHFTKQGRYFSAMDELRQPQKVLHTDEALGNLRHLPEYGGDGRRIQRSEPWSSNPLGALPGSVWRIALEPLQLPDWLGVDHYAAFPTEWPRRLIKGWSPSGICTACGEGRRPAVAEVGLDLTRPQARRAKELADAAGLTGDHIAALVSVGVSDMGRGAATQTGTGKNRPEVYALADHARGVLGGYAREYLLQRPVRFSAVCACPEPTAPTTPAVVLDPFGGTGTTAMIARALGRYGISLDLSADYHRIARWRIWESDHASKARERSNREAQGSLL